MEKWVLYDENRKCLNKVVDRDSILEKGEYHLSVHAWIKCNNKFLIFQRDESKKIFPNFYEPIAGGVSGYEDPLVAMIREVEEESGLKVSKEEIIETFYVVNDKCKYPEICDVYIFNHKFDIKDIVLEEGKNKNAQLLTKKERIKLIENNKFLPLVTYKDKINKF